MGSGPANLDWVFTAAGWVLGALGAAGVLWALVWDRSRGRRRCPKCWYELGGLPGLTCPECGRAARSERRLRRTRRRWRRAAGAALVCLAAAGVAAVPRYRQGGWVSVVPATALVFIAPLDAPEPAGAYGAGPGAGAVLPTTPGEHLHHEVWRRLDGGAMWRWQRTAYMRRWLREHPGELAREKFVIPARWPADRALRVCARPASGVLDMEARYPGGEWTPFHGGVYATLGWPGAGARVRAIEVRLMREGETVYTHEVPASEVVVEGTTGTFLVRVDSPEVSERLRAVMRPRLTQVAGLTTVHFQDRTTNAPWKALDFGVVFTVELRVRGRAVAAGRSFVDWLPEGARAPGGAVASGSAGASGGAESAERFCLEPEFVNVDATAIAAGEVELVLRGDPAEAGLMYCRQLPSAVRPACWTGELRVRVEATDAVSEWRGR